MNTLRIFLSRVPRNWASKPGFWRPSPLTVCLSGGAASILAVWYISRRRSNRPMMNDGAQPTDLLCGKCRSISLEEMRGPNFDRMQPHQPSYLALKQSVMSGCRLCGFIWTAFGQTVSFDGQRGSDALEHVSEKYPGREISLVAWAGGSPDSWLDRIQVITSGEVPDSDPEDESVEGVDDPTMHPDYQLALSGVLNIWAYPDDPAAWHGGVNGRSLPTTAGDSESDFEFVGKCLNECLSTHSNCHANEDAPLPTRVLDIGPPDGSQEPYLLESRGARGRYVALSHCWGGHVPLITTTDNLPKHKNILPMADLPPTFRDAVQISRRLGIQYLWIDSLCILQDSREDWEKESTKMADVYGGSRLTIAARAAKNAEVGCFIPREEMPPPCRVTYKSPDGSVAGSIYFSDPAAPIERVDETPLDQRGWVLQERILSPRIAYYGAQQIYWECREDTVRQDGKWYDIQQDTFRFGDFKQAQDPHAPFRSIFHGFHGEIQPDWPESRLERAARMGQWYRIAEEYSRRQISFPSDKLPAIVGVAKEFAKSTGYSYVAGLWQEDMLSGIMWSRRSGGPPISQKLPSWSWARFDGRVRFWGVGSGGLMLSDDSCKLINVSYRHTDAMGDFGEVSDARIELQGRIIPVDCKITRDPAYDLVSRPVLFDPDGTRLGAVNLDLVDSTYQPGELFCLLVYSVKYAPVGLALKREVGHGATFTRVGFISIDSGRQVCWKPEPCTIYLM